MDSFPAAEGRPVFDALIDGIDANAARLSQIDGATGDGDHGVNMDKGFLRPASCWATARSTWPKGSRSSARPRDRIGGAMGPLYGSFFLDMAAAIGAPSGSTARRSTGCSPRALQPSRTWVRRSSATRRCSTRCCRRRRPTATRWVPASRSRSPGAHGGRGRGGSEATRDMVARVGRASRLGERSRGFLDAGSVSCAIQLRAVADAMVRLLGTAASGAAS